MAKHRARVVCDRPRLKRRPRLRHQGVACTLVLAQANAIDTISLDSYSIYDVAYLWCSNHALFLCASGDETTANTSKIRVSTKAFPVPTSARDSSDRADEWAESNVNALSSVLSAESMAISEHKISIERSSKMNASRE